MEVVLVDFIVTCLITTNASGNGSLQYPIPNNIYLLSAACGRNQRLRRR